MLSFKHLFAAAFVVGSLLSVNHVTAEEESFLKKYENHIRWGVAAGVGLAVWKSATYQAVKDANGHEVFLAGLRGVVQKALAQAKPYVVAIPEFANKNKDAIQVTTAAVILARYGTNAINSFVDGLKFHNMKQGFPNAWVNVPAEEKAKA